MTSGIRTIIYPVRDLGRAKELFGTLVGAAPTTDMPYYVQFNVTGQEIGLNPKGHDQGMTTPMGYWHVDDIDAALERLIGAGAAAAQPVTEVGGGRRIASVKDADGNLIGLLQPA